jgi:hypothetical protein
MDLVISFHFKGTRFQYSFGSCSGVLRQKRCLWRFSLASSLPALISIGFISSSGFSLPPMALDLVYFNLLVSIMVFVVIQDMMLWAAASTDITLNTSSSSRKGGLTDFSHLSEFKKLTDFFLGTL